MEEVTKIDLEELMRAVVELHGRIYGYDVEVSGAEHVIEVLVHKPKRTPIRIKIDGNKNHREAQAA